MTEFFSVGNLFKIVDWVFGIECKCNILLKLICDYKRLILPVIKGILILIRSFKFKLEVSLNYNA